MEDFASATSEQCKICVPLNLARLQAQFARFTVRMMITKREQAKVNSFVIDISSHYK